ncbi:MAG: hypothetical protein WC967_09105 [Balneolaceae bacterium]
MATEKSKTSKSSTASKKRSKDEKLPEVDNRHKIFLYSTDCLNCYSLCSHADAKAYTKCHFSKGNEYCPAKQVSIRIGGDYKSIATKIVESMRKNDLASVTRKMNRLKRKEPQEQKEILRLVNEMLNENSD